MTTNTNTLSENNKSVLLSVTKHTCTVQLQYSWKPLHPKGCNINGGTTQSKLPRPPFCLWVFLGWLCVPCPVPVLLALPPHLGAWHASGWHVWAPRDPETRHHRTHSRCAGFRQQEVGCGPCWSQPRPGRLRRHCSCPEQPERRHRKPWDYMLD